MKTNNTTFVPVTATTLKETEKAYQLRVSYWTTERAPIKTTNIWVPKSCTEVTNGKVTGIADWILNNWANQRAEYVPHSASKYNPCFNIDLYHSRKADEKNKLQKQKEEFALAVDVVVKFSTPYAIEFMQQTAFAGHLVYDTFKDSNLLTTEELASLKNISDRMEKSFGKWSKADDPKVKQAVEEFPHNYTTLKEVADFLWREVDFPTLGIHLYNHDVRIQLKMPNGNLVSDNLLFNILNGYETSLVAKKFKKNFAFHHEFKGIVNTLYNRLNK